MALLRRGMHFGSYGSVDDGRAIFDRLCTAVLTAEAAGFDAVSMPDHMHQNDIAGGPSSPMFEAYTLLGALAMKTTSVRLLALVSPVTLRNPAMLAKAMTTLDVLSGGRAILGIGAGWDVDEHAAYGIDFPGLGERMDRLEEALVLCRALFRDVQASYLGTHYSIHDAWNSPRPIAGDIPIMVAGGGERRTLRIVAQYADACNVFGDADTVRHKFEVLERHCQDVGRDPAEITKTAFITETSDFDEFQAKLASLADVDVNGVVLRGTYDLAMIEALGAALTEALP